MTEVIYLEVSEKTEAAKKAGRRVSVSGMLKFLGAWTLSETLEVSCVIDTINKAKRL